MRTTLVTFCVLFICTFLISACKKEITPADVYAPNTITPNGDGINDRFYILNNDTNFNNHYQVELLIFDRNAKLIFRSLHNSASWDGTSKAIRVSNGLYQWKYQCTSDLGKVKIAKGHINVTR